jgi:hypothetical protein
MWSVSWVFVGSDERRLNAVITILSSDFQEIASACLAISLNVLCFHLDGQWLSEGLAFRHLTS